MKFPLLSILAVVAIPGLSASTHLVIPNASFDENEAQYTVPTSWVEDQDRVLSQGFVTSGSVASSRNLTPIHDNLMGRVSIAGDPDSSTSYSGTISTTLSETFAPNTTYQLQFHVARDNYVIRNEWFALGGLRANGIDVASITVDIRDVGAGVQDEFYPVSLSFSTDTNPAAIGETISVYVGMRHDGDNLKELFFDDVTLTATAIPEPSTYAALLGFAALIGIVLRRRR